MEASERTDRLIRLAEVIDMVGWGRSMIYRKIRTGEFPAPYKPGGFSSRWSEREICEWLDHVKQTLPPPSSAATISRTPTTTAEAIAAKPFDAWFEDHGDVLWWRFPIEEPPYCGTPLDCGFTIGAQLFNQFGDVVGVTRSNVGGWPFSEEDETDLFWTPISIPADPRLAVRSHLLKERDR